MNEQNEGFETGGTPPEPQQDPGYQPDFILKEEPKPEVQEPDPPQVYAHPSNMPGWGEPPQDDGWASAEYGPIEHGRKAGRAPKASKPPRKPKPPREKKPGSGYKVLAIVMTALFVLSIGGFGSYILYDISQNRPEDGPPVSAPTAGNTEGEIDINNIPREEEPEEPPLTGGKMTNNEIYQAVEPAVVGVVCYRKETIGTQLAGQGSGVAFSEEGYIVTNAHVVKDKLTGQGFEKIQVILSSGEKYDGQLIGMDEQTDLAVLQIQAENLTIATFGNSDQLLVGDKAIVIGNPSGVAFAGSFTQGTISALNRLVDVEGRKSEYIQTDAAINPGNSGGALVNEYGQVVGITTAKLAGEDYEGVGFAIPINNAKPIIDSLINDGWVRGRVKIGITYREIPESTSIYGNIPRGLRVISIEEGYDISTKDVQGGDIITHMDGQEVWNADDVAAVLEGKSPGETLELTIYRAGVGSNPRTFTVSIILSEKQGG